jgi:hypothetical protein
MNNRNVSKKINFSISPTNDSSMSVNAQGKLQGGYRFSGQNIIKFVIPAQDALLETETLNMDFQLLTLNAANDPVRDLDNLELNNGQISETTSINANPWAGVQSTISKVMVQSLKSPVELSNQVNYSNYCSVYDAHRFNENDYKDLPFIKHGCSGENSQFTNRHFNISPDATNVGVGTMTNLTQGSINDPAFGQFVSMKIKNPILSNSANLHMGQEFFGGLVVTIYLESNAGYFSQRFADPGTGQTYGEISNISYIVKNPRLRGKYILPSEDQLKAYSPQLVLNSRVSLINDIQSSTNVSTYTPQINLCKSFVNLFFNQDTFNTYSKNQYNYQVPLALQEYTELYNNIRLPRDYKIEAVNHMLNNQVQNGTANITPSNISPKAALQGLADIRLNFQKALFDGKLAYHTSACTKLTDQVVEESFKVRGATAQTQGVKNQQVVDALGIGSDYTASLNFTRNFFNNNYSLKIESGVASGDSKLPADSRDQFELQQSYVRNTEILDMRSLVKTM